MAKTKTDSAPTSVYLDLDSREKLDVLAETSDRSKSQVIRALIQAASADEREARLTTLATELAELLGVKDVKSRKSRGPGKG